MLIVCPSCASEHSIDSDYIGSVGRRVRCAACRTIWFVAAEGEEAAAEVDPFEAMMRNDEASAKRGSEPFGSEPEPPLPSEGPPTPKKRLLREKARSRRSSRGLAALPKGLPTFLVAIAALTGVVLARPAIVAAAPQAAALYALIGLPVNLRGLELRAIKSGLESAGGNPLLVVEGEIVNVRRAEVAVPPLEVLVLGADGQTLYTWTNEAPRKTLDHGEAAAFRARLASPPVEGRQVLVRFASASEGQAVGVKAH